MPSQLTSARFFTWLTFRSLFVGCTHQNICDAMRSKGFNSFVRCRRLVNIGGLMPFRRCSTRAITNYVCCEDVRGRTRLIGFAKWWSIHFVAILFHESLLPTKQGPNILMLRRKLWPSNRCGRQLNSMQYAPTSMHAAWSIIVEFLMARKPVTHSLPHIMFDIGKVCSW